MTSFTFLATLLLVAATVQAQCPSYELTTVTNAARTRAGLEDILDRFREDIGGRSNGDRTGSQGSGRREVGFGRVTVPFELSGDFFNRGSNIRGITMDTETGTFLVSTPPDGSDLNFDSILPSSLTDGFRPFTTISPRGNPPRLFSPLFSNMFTAKFRIPGTNRLAASSAFGAIFLDVDIPEQTYIEFLDQNDCLIQRVFVPAMNKGISFAGLIVKRRGEPIPRIYSVRVKLGTSSIDEFSREYTTSDTPNTLEQRLDVVVLDILLFGEPE